MTDTPNRISDYVESIAMDNFHNIIDDIAKTDQLIIKLYLFINQAEDKKILLKRSLVDAETAPECEQIRDNIAECNKIIRKIESDISHVRTASKLYVFYKKARKGVPKDILNKLDTEVNAHMLINRVSIGDKLTCIIPCDDINRNDVCECSNIDKFHDLIAVKGKNGYHNANHFRLNDTKV